MRLSLVGLTTASNDNFDMSPILVGREGGREGGKEGRKGGREGREGRGDDRETNKCKK